MEADALKNEIEDLVADMLVNDVTQLDKKSSKSSKKSKKEKKIET